METEQTFGQELERDYQLFEQAGAEKICIGRTVLGRPIFAFAVGCGSPKILVQYAIHAREYITYYLAKRHIFDTASSLAIGAGTVYFVPIVNIDGVSLVLDGKSAVPPEYHALLDEICPDGDFGSWKANIRGVDLNVNFDARWGTGSQNIHTPSSANFVGYGAHSEPEVRALADFTQSLCLDMTVSYHSKGEVIFYDFHQPPITKAKHYALARVASRATGYKIKKTGNSAGGYKDWCIAALHIPALTIEVGSDSLTHPIAPSHLEPIYQQNRTVILDLLTHLR